MSDNIGRNDPCHCGSGLKYKHCCLKGEKRSATRDYSVEAESYKGPGGYAPAIACYSKQPGREWGRDMFLVNPSKRFESPGEAEESAERDLASSYGALDSPFSPNSVPDLLQKAGYGLQEDFDPDYWTEQLSRVKKFADATETEQPTDSACPPRCGLCGNTINLTRTECCGNWICDDTDVYVMFSYGRNSCYRNHRRYTLCGAHYAEEHAGDWKSCKECREHHMKTELYVEAGTNEWNFENLENPPDYEPTHCTECGRVIRLAEEGFMVSQGDYTCEGCSDVPFS